MSEVLCAGELRRLMDGSPESPDGGRLRDSDEFESASLSVFPAPACPEGSTLSYL